LQGYVADAKRTVGLERGFKEVARETARPVLEASLGERGKEARDAVDPGGRGWREVEG